MPISPAEAAAKFRVMAESIHPRLVDAAETIAVIARDKAKSYIGNLQPEWNPLAQSTMDQKEKLGFGPPDYSPLERTGQLRDSIEDAVVQTPMTITAIVGSDDPVAVYQEFGTLTIPPRPFISLAMMNTVPEALELLEHIQRTMFTEDGE